MPCDRTLSFTTAVVTTPRTLRAFPIGPCLSFSILDLSEINNGHSSVTLPQALDLLPETGLPLSRLDLFAAIVDHKLFDRIVSALYFDAAMGAVYLPIETLPNHICKSPRNQHAASHSLSSMLTRHHAKEDHVCPCEFRRLHNGGVPLFAALVEVPRNNARLARDPQCPFDTYLTIMRTRGGYI